MDIVFLCGGEGTRLRPLTNVVPKPMLPIGSKPILEINITKAKEFGFKRNFLMVNYKAEVISGYFGDGSALGVSIEYFEERERRGTAGPLSFLKDIVTQPFVVMNADILTDLDLKSLLNSHKKNGADLTVALKRVPFDIPYGVAKLGENEVIEALEEKPTIEYMINSGIYVVSPNLIDLIPDTGMYQMTELITDAKEAGKSIHGHVFEDSWRDIGRLDDYIKATNENGDDSPIGSFGSDF